jgi:hypothetical protein
VLRVARVRQTVWRASVRGWIQHLSRSSTHLPLDHYPARTVTVRAVGGNDASSPTGRTLNPVILTDSALIQSLAPVAIDHPRAGAIGAADCISSLSAIGTTGDRKRSLSHKRWRFYSFVAADSTRSGSRIALMRGT